MSFKVIIQSRLSSSRLPAKALLPICAIPSLTLCALRAMSSGLNVIVATSVDSSDDILVNTLKKYKVPFIRGPLDDVLSRYNLATQDLCDSDIVVRLTADNVFPDGDFIEELVATLHEKKLSYLGTYSPLDGLPYGLSAEAFTVDLLRQACKNAKTDFERENVTPWMRQHYSSIFFKPTQIKKDLSHLRCTLDTFEDYIRLTKVFQDVDDPIKISYLTLCDKLACLNGEPERRVPFVVKNGKIHSTMVLGAAQLGMAYGRTNVIGKPEKNQAIEIIKECIKHGITQIDTARAYGESESLIGDALKGGLASQVLIVTKLAISELEENSSLAFCNSVVDASVFKSCRDLQLSSLSVVLLHNWKHRYICNQAIWNRLLTLKNDGVIKVLGASVYEPNDAIAALQDPNIKYLQIPFNILDWRWHCSDFIKAVSRRQDVVVHSRSVFLQGILCADSKNWPLMKGINVVETIKKIDNFVKKFNRLNRADLCIAYARTQPWITSVIVGIESIEQLKENINLFKNPVLTQDQCKIVKASFIDVPECFLNPSNWKNNEKST